MQVSEYREVYYNYEFTEYPKTITLTDIYEGKDYEEDIDEHYLANEVCYHIPRVEGPFEVEVGGYTYKGVVTYHESDNWDWVE